MSRASTSGPSPGAETIWTRRVRGARGPAPERTRDEIAAAAVTLADVHGLTGATMRAVSSALGTGAGSLYRYVASRDELLDLMMDAVLAELPRRPTSDAWLDDLVAQARDVLELHRRHRWLIEVDRSARALGPHAMDHFEAGLRILAPVHRSTAVKMEAIAMVTGVVSLFVRSDVSAPTRPIPPGQLFAPARADHHPYLVAALSEPGPPEPRADLFDQTLRSLLSGLLG